jgi:hypothetical protein
VKLPAMGRTPSSSPSPSAAATAAGSIREKEEAEEKALAGCRFLHR